MKSLSPRNIKWLQCKIIIAPLQRRSPLDEGRSLIHVHTTTLHFSKHLSFAVANPFESNFCYKEWSTIRFKPTFKWRFLFVLNMVQWFSNVTWFSSTCRAQVKKTNPSSHWDLYCRSWLDNRGTLSISPTQKLHFCQIGDTHRGCC